MPARTAAASCSAIRASRRSEILEITKLYVTKHDADALSSVFMSAQTQGDELGESGNEMNRWCSNHGTGNDECWGRWICFWILGGTTSCLHSATAAQAVSSGTDTGGAGIAINIAENLGFLCDF